MTNDERINRVVLGECFSTSAGKGLMDIESAIKNEMLRCEDHGIKLLALIDISTHKLLEDVEDKLLELNSDIVVHRMTATETLSLDKMN